MRKRVHATWEFLRPFIEKARRLFGRPVWGFVGLVSSVTPVGWAVFLLGLCAALWGFWWGWVEAIAVSIMCLLSLMLAVLVVVGRRSLDVDVHLPHARTVVGRNIVGQIRVNPTGRGRTAPAVVEMPVGHGVAQFFVPAVNTQRPWSEIFAIPAKRRGVITVGPVRMVRSDGLGLLRRVRDLAEPLEMIIHPVTVRIPFDATGFHSDIEGVITAKLSSSDVAFHALREYVPGDDRRNVHWPTTARTGTLVVRQFEETRRSHHVMVLDSAAESWRESDFELGVSIAASLVLAGVRESRQVSFATSSGWVNTHSALRMMDQVSLVDLEKRVSGLAERVNEVVAQCPGVSALTIVTSSETEHSVIGAALRCVGPDVEARVIQVKSEGKPRRARLGNAQLIECSSVEDIPRLLAVKR